MTSTAVTAVVSRLAAPQLNASELVLTCTKANVGDTLNVGSYSSISTILFAVASNQSAGAPDAVTWSGSTITFSSGTGTTNVFVVGY